MITERNKRYEVNIMCRVLTFWVWKPRDEIVKYLEKLGLTEPMEFEVEPHNFDELEGCMIILSSVTKDRSCVCNLNEEQKNNLIQIIDDLMYMIPTR